MWIHYATDLRRIYQQIKYNLKISAHKIQYILPDLPDEISKKPAQVCNTLCIRRFAQVIISAFLAQKRAPV